MPIKQANFYYSPNYLNIERTDGLLYIQITLKSGRSQEQKKELLQQAGRNVVEHTGHQERGRFSSCWSIQNSRIGRLGMASLR
ncbi:tautomerase family protein [Paenibacillus rhizoplanae]